MPRSGTSCEPRRETGCLLVVFLLAIAVRLGSVFATADVATVRYLIGDAAGYMAWAHRLADGAWIGKESFYQAPLYPYTLGVLIEVFGSSVLAARVMQCVWGAVGCALIAFAASRMFGRRVGWVSGVMLALYAPAIYYDGIIQKASLSCLLSCGVVAGVVACGGMMKRRVGLLALGVVVGLLCLTRENALLWLGVLGVWVVLRDKHQDLVGRIRDGAIYGAGALIALAPALTHNVYVSGTWSLTTSQSGPNFYIGNSAEADGRYRPLVRGHETPNFERADAARLAEAASGRALSPREVSAYWMGRSWDDIAADPARWMGLLVRKLLMTINRYEVADGDSLYVHARSSWMLLGLGSVWHFGLLFPLGAYGLFAAWRERRPVGVFAALLLSMTIGVAAFFILGRYRLPLVPVLVPFAAFGVVRLVDWVRCGQWRQLFGGVAVTVPLIVICHWPVHDEARLDALAAMNAGVALAQMGEVEEAMGLFEDAVAAHPTSVEANHNLALALAVQGRFAEAVPYYRRVLEAAPTLAGVAFNLGVALEQVGNVSAALEYYRVAVAQDPEDVAARRAVVRLGGPP